jgi:hypothetical protein
LFQNQKLEIKSVKLPERQSPIFENSGLEVPILQKSPVWHMYVLTIIYFAKSKSSTNSASAPVVATAPTDITARRQSLFHNNGQDSSSDCDDAVA